MSRAAAAVSVVPFTQHAEAVSGADWVWWWVDSTSAYGMLVQAKRLTMNQGRWRFDFGYPQRDGQSAGESEVDGSKPRSDTGLRALPGHWRIP